jgi:hypothetical protein
MKTKSKKQIILSVIGILTALLSYQFIYSSYMEKTRLIENETTKLETRVDKFKSLQENASFYQEEIDRMNNEMASIYKQFPGDVKQEDEIMLVKDMEENIDNLSISSLSFGTQEESKKESTSDTSQTITTGANTSTDASSQINSEGITSEEISAQTSPAAFPTLYKTPLNLAYKVSYSGLKDMVKYIYNKKERMTIDSISVYFDSSTGDLSGNMVVNMYLMKGTDNSYIGQDIPNITHGTDNIFGSTQTQ